MANPTDKEQETQEVPQLTQVNELDLADNYYAQEQSPSPSMSPLAKPIGAIKHKDHLKKNKLFDKKLYEEEEKKTQELYDRLFSGNRQFVEEKLQINENYFKNLSYEQKPSYLLIGCSDSRVPPDQLTKTSPGEIFIHRNVANLVVHTDMNVMAVLQYAVEVLKVKHVIVMGHYGCGGVKASIENKPHGIIDKWLGNIKDVYRIHRDELDKHKNDFEKKFRLLVELNIKEQVLNLCKTSIIQHAWALGSSLKVHGWVYDLHTGILQDLKIREKDWTDIESIYKIQYN